MEAYKLLLQIVAILILSNFGSAPTENPQTPSHTNFHIISQDLKTILYMKQNSCRGD